MQKNKRNSRDDRSGAQKKPVKRSAASASKTSRPKTERSADPNNGPAKRFESREEGTGFKGNRGTSGKSFEKGREDRKPASFKPFEKSGDEKRTRSAKPFAKSAGEKKPSSFKPFEKREDKRTHGNKPFENNRDEKRAPSGRLIKSRGENSISPEKRDRAPRKDDKFRDKRAAPKRTGDHTSRKRVSTRVNTPRDTDHPVDGLIRLNRYISNAGICSRRKADELIAAGVISVNGEVVSELGFKVDAAKDNVRYNGELLKREKMIYVLLNKPKDYITTTDDPLERNTVMQLVARATRERLYPVGRLDRNTTGLLLLTNDGDLTDKLSHPKNNVTKIYNIELNKGLTQGDLNKIAFGLELEDGLIKPDAVSYVQGGSKREVGIQIHSGKNRIVRRIFEHLGYDVVKLDRVIYAGLTKKDLPRGRWRYLEEKEVIQLKHLL